MTHITPSHYGDTPFQQLLGHHPSVTDVWSALGDELEKDGHLSASLKEQVRRTLAQQNGCAYCKAKGKPDPDTYDEKTSIAIGFTEVFLAYKKDAIPDFAYDLLREQFNEAEISELFAFLCFTSAQQFFGALMNLQPSEV